MKQEAGPDGKKKDIAHTQSIKKVALWLLLLGLLIYIANCCEMLNATVALPIGWFGWLTIVIIVGAHTMTPPPNTIN